MQSFTELNLSSPLLRAITELGFQTPSPIQAQALPILLGEPTDFLGLAATGTGKTAAFGIPLLERVEPTRRAVQGLVLCPTRELAIQVADQLNLLGKHKDARALPVYGGASFVDQIHGLKRGATVVVGTPGRIVDHLERGTLRLDAVETVVLDEADEMISMGFKEDLETILNQVPDEGSNIWLFSATMSPEVRKVADEYLTEPKQVQINRTEMLPDTIEQLFYTTQEANKPEVLCKLIDMAQDFYGLVFCQTKSLVIDLTQYLKGRNYRVDCLHGDMDQSARERTMKAFRERRVNLLICTDVASRGLDVKDITHVINYSIPRELDSYVHRIGRTARSGKSGFAMSLVTGGQRGLVARIERMTKSRIKEGKIPSRKEIGEKKVSRILEGFQGQKLHQRASELMGSDWKKALTEMTQEEVASRFLCMMFPEVFCEREEAKGLRALGASPVQPVGAAKPGVSVLSRAPESSEGDADRPARVKPSRGGRSLASRGVRADRAERPEFRESKPRFQRWGEKREEKKGFGKSFGKAKGFAKDSGGGFGPAKRWEKKKSVERGSVRSIRAERSN